MNGLWPRLLLISGTFGLCVAQNLPHSIPQSSWEAADRLTVRLDPAAFPELPSNVLAALRQRGCTIPQVPMIQSRHNVIHGEFAKPGQTDWAALCSVGRVSSILIFWNGSEVSPAEIEKRADLDGLQGNGGDSIVYSRAITAVGGKFITEHYDAYGGPKPPPVDHQGVDDAFVGKASEVLYFYHAQWLRLTGAD